MNADEIKVTMSADVIDEDLLQQIIEQEGMHVQFGIMIEECAELITAMMHFNRGKAGIGKVADELADVLVMARTVRLIIGPARVDEIVVSRMSRIRKLVRQN